MGKNKLVVSLYDSIGTSLIVSWKTGILYSNQTGGFACLQPEYEGIHIPICNDILLPNKTLYSPENDLEEYFEKSYSGCGATSGIDMEDAKAIESIFKKYRINHLLEVNTEKLDQSHEAWVHVKLLDGNGCFNFYDYPIDAILTWNNSD